MKAIVRRRSEPVYIVETVEQRGVIVDLREERIMTPPRYLQALLARGSWEDVESGDKGAKRAELIAEESILKGTRPRRKLSR